MLERESGGSAGAAPAASQGEQRQRVHERLASPEWRGRWLGVLDDLPAPFEYTLEEAGLDWMREEFPWAHGRSVITARAAEWMQDEALCGSTSGGTSSGAQVGSFEEDEARAWVSGKVLQWVGYDEGVCALVQYLGCFPLAVAQAAEYARLYLAATPVEYLAELKRAGLRLGKSKRHASRKDYPHSFPDVVKLSVDRILQSDDEHAAEAGRALRKLALLSTEAIPLELLAAEEKAAVPLLEEHSLVTRDAQGLGAMHALTQLVVRDQLTERAERAPLAAAVARALTDRVAKFNHVMTAT